MALNEWGSYVDIWNLGSNKLMYSLKGEYADFSPDSKWIISIQEGPIENYIRGRPLEEDEEGISIYETTTGNLINRWKVNTKFYIYHSFFINNDSERLFIFDGIKVKVWDIISGNLINSLRLGRRGYTLWDEVEFSPDGKWVVGDRWINWGKKNEWERGAQVKIWQLSSGALINKITLPEHYCISDSPGNISFSAEGEYFSIGIDCLTVGIWESATGRLLHSFNTGDMYYRPQPAIFSPDGKWVATTGYAIDITDNGIEEQENNPKIWEMKTGRLVWDIKGDIVEFHPFLPLILIKSTSMYSFVSLETGNSIFSWTYVGSNDWMVVHPSGLFDTSPGAMEKLYFVQDNEIIELDSLKDKYYEPRLWEKVMSGEPLRILDE
jgi:WD40 repeat protein